MSSALPAGGALRDPKALFSLLCPNGLLAEAASDRCMGNSEASVCAAFSQWPVILQANISRLAAFELLALLQDFESTQLAGVGLAGASLVSACILAAGGGYTGLMVRPERKSYGARRKIEGLPDPAAKVAVVVDALGTGRLLLDAIRSLEDGGMTVEGVVGLIELPYRGGAEELRSLGYRVATVFNSHSDYESPAKTETTSTMRMPAHLRPRQPQWSISKVPDGLHPAHAARVVAEHLVSTGEVLTPPRYFEQDENGSGGVWVSLRRRSDDHRVARNGFWHFDALESDVPIDVVLATAMTVQSCRPALTGEKLAELKIAVTFFSALEAVAPTALDFSRYGIVVRSRPFPSKMGGALPDTQYFTSTFEQYRHARETNAGIGAFEPHDVFRHPVTKRIEPGASWPAFGVGSSDDHLRDDLDLGERLVGIVHSILKDNDGNLPAPDHSQATRGSHQEHVTDPASADADLASHRLVAVTLYERGHATSAVSTGSQLEESAARAAHTALALRKSAASWPALAPNPHDGFAVAVLYEPERLGLVTASEAARTIRAGRDSFSVSEGERSGLFLDAMVCQQSWSKKQATAELARQAGISSDRAWWTTYKTASWTCRSNRVYPIEFGARRRDPGDTVTSSDVALMAEHIHRRLDANSWPACLVVAPTGGFERTGRASWCIQALRSFWEAALRQGRADWRDDAERGLNYAVRHLVEGERPTLAIPGHRCDPMADAALLYSLAKCVGTTQNAGDTTLKLPAVAAMHRIASRIASWVAPNGSLLPEGVTPSRSDPDCLPGMALLAVATYSVATARDLSVDWPRVFNWYRTRFELVHPWDLAAWHSQLWPVVSLLTGDSRYGELALEMADWMCHNQLEVDGSFLSNSSNIDDAFPPGPSSQVAPIAESIASAWRWAASIGDAARCRCYEQTWLRAMGFLDRLLVRGRDIRGHNVRGDDTYWMPQPAITVGAIRTTQSSYELRADSSSHALSALMTGLDAQENTLRIS